MEAKGKTDQLTIRLSYELHRALRFVSADKETSINKLVESFILQGLQGYHISPPIELQRPGERRSA
jgi:predicted HicB family RNase H-like nuclease